MPTLIADSQLITTAAWGAQQINSAIDQARVAAASPTTSMLAAANDEVSAATVRVFGALGQEYQALLRAASLFHEQFAAALSAATNAYDGAEAAASSMLGTVAAHGQVGVASFAPTSAATTIGLFMGGTGEPIPSQLLVELSLNYVNYPKFQVDLANALALVTPEQTYPLTGIKSLPLDISVSQGVQILENAITQQISAGNNVAVFGASQSAVVESLVMQNLLSATSPTPSQLSFTLAGDLMAPNGGLFERFAGLTLPSFGFDFYGATPPNTQFPTNIYTLQYDGFADFPRYPIDFLADLNALVGTTAVHPYYPEYNPGALPPGDHLVTLPTSPGYHGETTYYMITQPGLPLLNPVRDIPVIGKPLADLLQPDLTYLVNWGFGNPLYGYSTSYANVPTPFGVLPPLSATTALPGLLAIGAQQGGAAFMSDISAMAPPSLPSLSLSSAGGASFGGFSLPTQLPTIPSPDSIIGAIEAANASAATFISNAFAQSYAVLLPVADFANSLLVTLPSYDVNLFLNGIEQALGGDPVGGLTYAFGAPIAADLGLVTLETGFVLVPTITSLLSII